jgi:excisionase family DNA binding protein
VSYHPLIRAKAVALRTESGMTIDEIAERLAVSRTTIYGWVGDIPIERKCRGKRNRLSAPGEN